MIWPGEHHQREDLLFPLVLVCRTCHHHWCSAGVDCLTLHFEQGIKRSQMRNHWSQSHLLIFFKDIRSSKVVDMLQVYRLITVLVPGLQVANHHHRILSLTSQMTRATGRQEFCCGKDNWTPMTRKQMQVARMKSLARAVPEHKIRVRWLTMIWIVIKITKEIIAGPVKVDKHRGLVPSLPDGKEHGLPHVQVGYETLQQWRVAMMIVQRWVWSFAGISWISWRTRWCPEILSPFAQIPLTHPPTPSHPLPIKPLHYFNPIIVHVSQSCARCFRWIKCIIWDLRNTACMFLRPKSLLPRCLCF